MRYLMIIALTLACPAAYAKGGYVGVSAGFAFPVSAGSNMKRDSAFLARGSTYDNHAPGAGLFGGYRFNDYVGLEGGAVFLGNYKGQITSSSSFFGPGEYTERDSVSTLYGAAVLRYPFTHLFSAFSKVGATYYWNHMSCTASGFFSCRSYNTRNVDLMFGFGMGFRPPGPFVVNVEYDQFNGVGNYQYTAGDFRYLNLNVIYRF